MLKRGPIMNITSVLSLLALGAVAGWLAGLITRGGGLGLLGNIVLGIAGSLLGGYLFGLLGLRPGGGWAGSLLSATVGAVALLYLIRLIKRA
jgi:uncharacterized membrane protein YeaQ/YmgE (transglycosylase-associated protein family)